MVLNLHDLFAKSLLRFFFFSDWLNHLVVEHEKTLDENQLRDFIDAFLVEKRKGKKDFTVRF